MARSVRDRRYLYIRNYMPHLSPNQPSVFSDLGEIRREITELAETRPDTLTPAQLAYAGPDKPVEEFYDCQTDPENVHNLLEGELTKEQEGALARLREAFAAYRARIGDLGALPETTMRRIGREEDAPIRDVVRGETNHSPDLGAAWAAADLVGSAGIEELIGNLSSTDPAIRYWAIVGLHAGHAENEAAQRMAADHLEDVAPEVRIETAFWLTAASDPYREAALDRLSAETANENWWTALQACRAIELLGEKAITLVPVMRELHEQTRHKEGDENLFIAFSTSAFLDGLGVEIEPWDFSPQ